MKEGNKYFLTETIRCMLDQKPYGFKGDEVILISTIHDPVAIVEDDKGERFLVQMNKLSEKKVEKENDHGSPKEQATKKPTRSKTKLINQPLF